MRNVFKGFQASKLAVPKVHAANINKEFSVHHTATLHRPALRIENQKMPKSASRPGKNVGVKRGHEVL